MNAERFTALNDLEFKLLNAFQRDFPLVPRPFTVLAERFDCDESAVLHGFQRLQDNGVVSRIGPVFRPNAIGASALAALAVPPDRLDEVAAYVSALPEVNHNYEREHRFNLWFVATASSQTHLEKVLNEIEGNCQCGPVLVLPMIEDYHIDLGFDLSASAPSPFAVNANASATQQGRKMQVILDANEQALVGALQSGLPIVERPFAQLGLPESDALEMIGRWVEQGVIKRFGVVVRHHELGYKANAMVVWDVPESEISKIGRLIASTGQVTLCYRRPRRLPHWQYNLFCMIHGKDRSEVESRIRRLTETCDLGAYSHDILFSLRRFKQRGALYAVLHEERHGRS